MIEIFMKAVNVSIAAGWLILVITVLRLWRRAPRRIVCLMWGAAALRLILPYISDLMPVRFVSRLSMIPSSETLRVCAGYLGKTITPDTGLKLPDMALAKLHAAASDRYGDIRITLITDRILKIAVLVWLCGTAAMLIYAAVSCIALRLKVRESVPDGDIRVCDRIKSPFVLGFFRPKIYVPSGMDDTVRVSVTAHERAHIKRGDHIWRLIGWLLLSVYWFSPLVWLAFVLYCRDTELACDEAVIKTFDADGIKAYSDALLSIGSQKHAVSVCPLAFGETGVKARIKAALKFRRPTALIIVISLILCCLSVMCFGAPNTAYDGGIVKLISSLRTVTPSTSNTEKQTFDIKTDSDAAGMTITVEVWREGKLTEAYASRPFTADSFSLDVTAEMNNKGTRFIVPGIYDLCSRRSDDILFYLGYPDNESCAHMFSFADIGGMVFSPGHSVYLACRDCRSGNYKTGIYRFISCGDINDTPKILKETEYTVALKLNFYDKETTDKIINQYAEIGVYNPFYASASEAPADGYYYFDQPQSGG